MTQELKISKLDATKRQLEVAINLYFHNGDPISIHTLTAAAYNVLRNINKHRKGNPLLIKEQIRQYVKSENRAGFDKQINKAENFFKHAEHDPEDILTFYPQSTEFLLWEACIVYFNLTSESSPHMNLFRIWFTAINKDLIIEHLDSRTQAAINSFNFKQNERTSYFNQMLPVIIELGTI